MTAEDLQQLSDDELQAAFDRLHAVAYGAGAYGFPKTLTDKGNAREALHEVESEMTRREHERRS